MKKLVFFLLLLSFSVMGASRAPLSKKEQSEALALFKIYESLHGAFFDYSATDVEKYSQELKVGIEKLSAGKVKETLKTLPGFLSKIKASNPRNANDEIFDGVSSALINVLSKFDLGSDYNGHSCPMVKKVWVQNTSKSGEIANPYAPNMKRCGTRDTNF